MNNIYIKKHDQIIKYLYRWLGYYICLLVKKLPITPNFLTLLRFPIVVLGGYSLYINDFYLKYLACFFFILFSVLDSADGILARMKNNFSTLGSWLDIQTDRCGLLIMIISISLSNLKLNSNYFYILLYFITFVLLLIKDFEQEDLRNNKKLFKLNDCITKFELKKKNKKKNFTKKMFQQIYLQTNPHNFNFVIYIVIGIIFDCVNQIFLFLLIYILFVYLRNASKYFIK